jgi:hypothetical protein
MSVMRQRSEKCRSQCSHRIASPSVFFGALPIRYFLEVLGRPQVQQVSERVQLLRNFRQAESAEVQLFGTLTGGSFDAAAGFLKAGRFCCHKSHAKTDGLGEAPAISLRLRTAAASRPRLGA